MKNRKTALVTDSTADIPPELVDLYHIHVVPNVMVVDGQSLDDGKGLSRREFYERLPAMRNIPTTATASSGAYEQLYADLLEQGASEILSIHCASTLSGIYNAARLAATTFGARVQVIDSGQLTLGLGFQVLAAAESIAKGAPILKVLEMVKNVRERIRVFAMLDTLEYVRRSGRVSWARAQLGNLLQIKPFIEVKAGKVIRIGEVRTRRKGIERLKNLLYNLGPLEKLAVLHTNADSEANQFIEEILPDFGNRPMLVNITTIIGVYTGPNGLGFAAVLESPT
jgi:DegV family protein with EDD domain